MSSSKLNTRSSEDLLAAFSNLRVLHPNVETVLDEISLFLAPYSGVDILLLIGITGVGKTTLGKGLRAKTYRDNLKRMEEEVDFVPAVFIEAPSAGGPQRAFSWRLLYEAILDQLEEPLIHRKVSTSSERVDGISIKSQGRPGSLTGLRKATENALKFRRCRFIWIDEAVHILQQAGEKEILANMNTLKSLANTCGATIVLVGSYDLFEILKLNGQLARRCHAVHFVRYHSSDRKDRNRFELTAKTIAKEMHLDVEVDIGPHIEILLESCIGCVGIMKDVLQRAYTLALMNGGKWNADYVRRCRLKKHQTQTILSEALAGETMMTEAANWAVSSSGSKWRMK